ncbi:hypothetical protein GE21DRAFT_1309105 [Neurospora crassa]|nr:hypothetical protein GE21DRAFT_1309105 [Neurospora crassa]
MHMNGGNQEVQRFNSCRSLTQSALDFGALLGSGLSLLHLQNSSTILSLGAMSRAPKHHHPSHFGDLAMCDYQGLACLEEGNWR